MKKIIYLFSFLLCLFVSCTRVGDEPIIEGESIKIYDYRAQEYTLKVVTVNDRSKYTHRSDWWIIGIYEKSSHWEKVDTLPNGDMRISADWLSCIVPKNKATIQISLQENNSHELRKVSFLTNSLKGKGPSFTVIQEGRPR